MNTWVDYKAIRAQVTMEQILEHYGVLATLREKGESLVGVCPIHKGTNGNQFHVSRTKNNFMCFGTCHGGGNVIDFVVMMEGGSKENKDDVRRAALNMTDWFGLEFERPRGSVRKEAVPHENPDTAPAAAVDEPSAPVQDKVVSAGEAAVEPTPPETPAPRINPPLKFSLKNLDPSHPYLADRGLTKETIAEFGLGFCAKGIMAGRIAIPIHNEQGELLAYAGRWPGEPPEGEGKYKLPAQFDRSLVVYNLHRARECAKDGLIVVEGFFDAMRVWSAGFPNVVALMGSSLSEEQEALIVDTVGPNGRVALLFDEDEAGRKGREEALSRLGSKVYVKVIGLGEEGRQPDTMSDADLKTSIFGL